MSRPADGAGTHAALLLAVREQLRHECMELHGLVRQHHDLDSPSDQRLLWVAGSSAALGALLMLVSPRLAAVFIAIGTVLVVGAAAWRRLVADRRAVYDDLVAHERRLVQLFNELERRSPPDDPSERAVVDALH